MANHRTLTAKVVPANEAAVSKTGEQTRLRLFEAAERQFATKGYNAASVRDITNEAETNIAAVNYHFGGKENLYIEMYRRILLEMRDARLKVLNAAMNDPDATLESVLTGFAHVFFEPLKEGSSHADYLLPLWLREMTEPRLPERLMFDQFLAPVTLAFREALQKTCPGLEEEACQMCIHNFVGQLVHIAQALNIYRNVDKELTRYPVDLDLLLKHAVTYAAAGIRACVGGNGQ